MSLSTFYICWWLFGIMLQLMFIGMTLGRIAKALERSNQ